MDNYRPSMSFENADNYDKTHQRGDETATVAFLKELAHTFSVVNEANGYYWRQGVGWEAPCVNGGGSVVSLNSAAVGPFETGVS